MPTPPDAETEEKPLASPLHFKFVPVAAEMISDGTVNVVLIDTEHPPASVAVTV